MYNTHTYTRKPVITVCWAQFSNLHCFLPSLHSLQDTFEKRSREASVEPTTRPAVPYSPGEDESRDEEEEGEEEGEENLANLGLAHLSDNVEDDDDDIA